MKTYQRPFSCIFRIVLLQTSLRDPRANTSLGVLHQSVDAKRSREPSSCARWRHHLTIDGGVYGSRGLVPPLTVAAEILPSLPEGDLILSHISKDGRANETYFKWSSWVDVSNIRYALVTISWSLSELYVSITYEAQRARFESSVIGSYYDVENEAYPTRHQAGLT